MSAEDVAGPSRPKRVRTGVNNYCGLSAEDAQAILQIVGDEDLYCSEEEPFLSSGSEYAPTTSSDSETSEDEAEDVIVENAHNERVATELPEEQKIVWTHNEFIPQKHDFDASHSGINENCDFKADSLEIDFLFSILTPETIDIIVLETNRYARKNNEQWSEMDRSEFYVFLALNMLMARNRKLTVHEYWSTDPLMYSPIFGQHMSRDRFANIYRFLHFCNNDEVASTDRLCKLRNVLEKIKEKFKSIFYPFEHLVIDESLVLFKGRLVFKQYIKSKRHRFGIKLYVLCDCETGYALDFIVYIGKDTDLHNDANPHLGITGAVVVQLLTPYLNKGHSLYTDNFYSSPSLSQFLLDKKTNSCGTVRQNRKDMPQLTEKLKKGETSWRSSDKLLVIKWKDRRDVTMISTMHENKMVTIPKIDRHTKEKMKKPLVVLDYNDKMGAVDRCDMLITSIDSMRKNIKWYKKLFFHVLDLCVINAHALFLTQHETRIPLAVFQLNIIRQLLER